MRDDDFPPAAHDLRKLSEKEARKLIHDTPEKDHDKAAKNHLRQLDEEKQHPHPAAELEDQD